MKSFFYVRIIFLYVLTVAATCFAASTIARADQKIDRDYFSIGSATEFTTFDPQTSTRVGDHALSNYLFDPMFKLRNGEIIPILVSDYEWGTPTRWLFTLKKGLRFHDGRELTTKDVAATARRACKQQNWLHKILPAVCRTQVIDRYRFSMETASPNPEMTFDLTSFWVIDHRMEAASEQEFKLGEELNGTGPYQLVAHEGFQQLDLAAFPDYHRGRAYLNKVRLKVEADEQKRLQAFLQGKYDMIDEVPDPYAESLRDKARVNNIVSHYVYLFFPDMSRDVSPDIFDHQGRPLTKNPLKDLRVRQALSKTLDRGALLEALYGNQRQGQLAGQLVNDSVKGTSINLKPELLDIDGAKALLAEAGYEQGFQLVLRDKDNRRGFLEAMVPMLEKINIKAIVKTLPGAEYFPRMFAREFSFGGGFLGFDGSLLQMMKHTLASDGQHNAGGYHNPEVDQLIVEAQSQVRSETLRHRALNKAHEIAIRDLAVIPLVFMSSAVAIRPDLVYQPGDGGYLEAYYVKPAAE